MCIAQHYIFQISLNRRKAVALHKYWFDLETHDLKFRRIKEYLLDFYSLVMQCKIQITYLYGRARLADKEAGKNILIDIKRWLRWYIDSRIPLIIIVFSVRERAPFTKCHHCIRFSIISPYLVFAYNVKPAYSFA